MGTGCGWGVRVHEGIVGVSTNTTSPDLQHICLRRCRLRVLLWRTRGLLVFGHSSRVSFLPFQNPSVHGEAFAERKAAPGVLRRAAWWSTLLAAGGGGSVARCSPALGLSGSSGPRQETLTRHFWPGGFLCAADARG